MQTLEEWIEENFSSKAEFARAAQAYPQQVSLWLSKNYMVHEGVMYRPVREFNQDSA